MVLNNNKRVSESLQLHRLQPDSLLCPWNSPGKNTGMGYHSLLQGIFPAQGSHPCLLYWQADSLPLSHQEVQLSLRQWFILLFSLACQWPLSLPNRPSFLKVLWFLHIGHNIHCWEGGRNWIVGPIKLNCLGTLLNVGWQSGWEGIWRRMNTCNVWPNPFAVLLKLSQHC